MVLGEYAPAISSCPSPPPNNKYVRLGYHYIMIGVFILGWLVGGYFQGGSSWGVDP